MISSLINAKDKHDIESIYVVKRRVFIWYLTGVTTVVIWYGECITNIMFVSFRTTSTRLLLYTYEYIQQVNNDKQ